MKRMFKKGQRVKSKKNGRVMEVLKYIRDRSQYLVECAWFDLEKKEVRVCRQNENNLLKMS